MFCNIVFGLDLFLVFGSYRGSGLAFPFNVLFLMFQTGHGLEFDGFDVECITVANSIFHVFREEWIRILLFFFEEVKEGVQNIVRMQFYLRQ